MSTSARRRLLRDFKKLKNDPPTGVSGIPLDNNIMVWQAIICGPDDTVWEGGIFNLVIKFSEDYPNKPPKVRFVTQMFHPNIYADGQICLDILQNQWSPIYDIAAILTSIQSLLSDPNPASPANSEAAKLYEDNRREYDRRVRAVVEASLKATGVDDEEDDDVDVDEDDSDDDSDSDSDSDSDMDTSAAASGAGAGAGGGTSADAGSAPAAAAAPTASAAAAPASASAPAAGSGGAPALASGS